MRTRVSSKGQIVLPAEFRRQDGIEPGQQFDVERVEAGEYRLKRAAAQPNAGLVQLLLECPVKGWYQPFDRSETTDDLQLPTLG